MSTELNSIRTHTRLDISSTTSQMLETDIYATAFYGGKERGRSLQLTIVDGVKEHYKSTLYAHFTVDEAIELRKVLTTFIEKNY